MRVHRVTITEGRAFAVWTLGEIQAFRCPVCTGPCLTRPLPRRACLQDHDWVCHHCGAFGVVHAGVMDDAGRN